MICIILKMYEYDVCNGKVCLFCYFCVKSVTLFVSSYFLIHPFVESIILLVRQKSGFHFITLLFAVFSKFKYIHNVCLVCFFFCQLNFAYKNNFSSTRLFSCVCVQYITVHTNTSHLSIHLCLTQLKHLFQRFFFPFCSPFTVYIQYIGIGLLNVIHSYTDWN